MVLVPIWLLLNELRLWGHVLQILGAPRRQTIVEDQGAE
jgi:hypothetical protein